MNINNFESHINKTILDRGYSYYMEGNVVDTVELGENKYIFTIEGSDHYEVSVDIGNNGDILFSECDCPYDFGPVCKHEVAAYFELFNRLNSFTSSDHLSKKPHKRTTVQEILSNLSKEELINIIINLANEDDILENSLILKYSNADHQHELRACKEFIHLIVRKYTGREGFIRYRDANAFVRELEDIVEKARNTENVHLAIDIALLLLEEAVKAFQYADDSNGDIGFLVTETLNVLGEIAIKAKEANHQRIEVFEKLLGQTDNKVFDGWIDFKIDLLHICTEFADDETLRELLRNKIESMLEKQANDRYTHYENERMLQLLFQLIEQYDTEEKAEQFIHEHLQFSSFREQLLEKHLQAKNYHKAIELAIEGEQNDKQYLGLVSKWKKIRYLAYKFLVLKEEQQKLAKELLFEGNFEYYQELKELASTENHSEFYAILKQELKTREGRHSDYIFLELIKAENDLEELLKFVKRNPSYIEEYANQLVEPFKEEVIVIYKQYIKSVAGTSSNRRDYQRICQKIKRYKKIAGMQNQVELINELMGLYQKRPAFIDELGKIR